LAKNSNLKKRKQTIRKLSQKAGLLEEKRLKTKGHRYVAGVDEVGRGAWAGPLVACACILNEQKRLSLWDSKLLSEKQRKKLSKRIKEKTISYHFAVIDPKEIENKGLQQAGLLALKRAIEGLNPQPDFVLVDYYQIPNLPIPQKGIIKGDGTSASIAAASILAKVYRDNLMKKLARQYPGYQFEKNKGYGTKEHLEALNKQGPCKLHRKNFRPIKSFFDKSKDKPIKQY